MSASHVTDPTAPPACTRRESLRRGLGAAWSGLAVASGPTVAADPAPPARPVAGIVTVYRPDSHADVILTKILRGWRHDDGPGPALRLASVFIDQPETSRFGRELCARHGVPVVDSIEEALTLGGRSIAVDGVLSIGEHGDYPLNAIGQQLYPRRRFLEEITAAFARHGRVVPVFNDKHLGPVWADARWMYDRAQELGVPFMAGSSLPVGFRTAEIDLPAESEITAAVGIGYGGLEIYGFHALEFYQCHVERRRGAERGVRAVRLLEGPALWRAVDDGAVSRPALEAAFEVVPKRGRADMRADKDAALFLFEHLDGLVGAVLYLPSVAGTAIGLEVAGRPRPLATAFDERTEPRYPHFAYLLTAIERMIHTGRPTYPVERTLLTSGILDRALTSRAQGGTRLETPELAIAYRPVEYPHAPHVELRGAG